MQGLLVATVCFLVAAPYRAENCLAWPPLGSTFLVAQQPNNPFLEGPDAVDPGPVLQLAPTDARLDGQTIDLGGLAEELETMKYNYFLLRPNEPYLGSILVLCSAETPTDRLRSFLLTAYRTGHRSVVFAFTKREDFSRPILGEFHTIASTGAAATLVLDSEGRTRQPGVALLPAQAYPTYGALATELVALRRAGKEVRMGLGGAAGFGR
jgi:hypothetical protein